MSCRPVGGIVVKQAPFCIFGGSASVTPFWVISTVTGIKRAPDLAMALLLLHYEWWPKIHLTFVTHCLIAAKKSIDSEWKQPDPPEFVSFLLHLNTQTQCELVFSVINGKSQSFCVQWLAWLCHMFCSSVMVAWQPHQYPPHLGCHTWCLAAFIIVTFSFAFFYFMGCTQQMLF